jgi:hypothetical protein
MASELGNCVVISCDVEGDQIIVFAKERVGCDGCQYGRSSRGKGLDSISILYVIKIQRRKLNKDGKRCCCFSYSKQSMASSIGAYKQIDCLWQITSTWECTALLLVY